MCADSQASLKVLVKTKLTKRLVQKFREGLLSEQKKIRIIWNPIHCGTNDSAKTVELNWKVSLTSFIVQEPSLEVA